MCIRDRSVHEAVVGNLRGVGNKAEDSLVKILLDATHNLGPVSYTHLRAHETVLDLVCRLLLEKQKKYTKTTTMLLCACIKKP